MTDDSSRNLSAAQAEEYAKMFRWYQHGMAGALVQLNDFAELRDACDRLIANWVRVARQDGSSWADVGGALGMTRQAAQQRYGARRSPDPPPAGEPLF